jgi:peptide subunit release factor 1 (eRF1)
MEYESLEEHFKVLVSIEATSSPLISCYIKNDNFSREYREDLDLRISEIRKVLSQDQREDFEKALGQLESCLVSEEVRESKGFAIFSRAGTDPFFKVIKFNIPFETELTVDSLPHLYQLVLMKDTYHRYVVLVTEESHARIIEVSVGNITRELWAEKPEIKQKSGRGWTKQHYQNYKRDRNQKFIKEKIRILDKLFTEGNHNYLLLAGNRQNILKVKDKLPKNLQEKVVDNIQIEGSATSEDIISASLSIYADFEANESVDRAGILLNEVKKGGLAVTDSSPSLKALQNGQVDTLIMSENYQSPLGWKCKSCFYVETGKQPIVCNMCSCNKTQEINVKEEVLRLAKTMSAHIEILRKSDELSEVNGIGCLLRY